MSGNVRNDLAVAFFVDRRRRRRRSACACKPQTVQTTHATNSDAIAESIAFAARLLFVTRVIRVHFSCAVAARHCVRCAPLTGQLADRVCGN